MTACAAAAVAYAALDAAVAPPPLHSDTLRDLEFGQACLRGDPCTEGPPSQLRPLSQGTLWPRLLAGQLAQGTPWDALHHLWVAVTALAAALIGAATLAWSGAPQGRTRSALRHLAPRSAGATAMVAFLTLAFWAGALPTLWHPTWLLPASACFAGLATWALQSGRLPPVALASLALGASVEGHIAALTMVPGWALATAARVRAQGRLEAGALGLSAGVLAVAPFALLSPGSFGRLFEWLPWRALVPCAACGLLASTAAGLAWRRAAPPAWAAMAAVPLLSLAALGFGAGVLGGELALDLRHGLAPLVVALPVAVGAVARLAHDGRVGRRGAVAVSVAVVAAPGLAAAGFDDAVSRTDHGPRLHEAHALAARLAPLGPAGALPWRVRTTIPQIVHGAVEALSDPRDAKAGPPDDGGQLVLVPIDRLVDEVPRRRGWEVLPFGGGTLLIHAERPWIRSSPAEACAATGRANAPWRCERRVAPSAGVERVREPGRTATFFHGADAVEGRATRFVFPVRVPAGAAPRVIRVVGGGCAPSVVAVDGVAADGALPAERVVLLPDPSTETEGRVTFELLDGPCAPYGAWPPAWLELSETDDRWVSGLLPP